MAKKDYREKIEEDRQQIEVETELSRLSRSKHKAKKRRNPLISILLVTFILIPLSLLFYVKFFYEPKPAIQEVKAADEQVELETNKYANKKQQEDKEQDRQQTEVEQQNADDKKQEAAEEQAKKDAELAAAQKVQQAAAAKKAEEERKAAEAQQAAEQATQQPSSKSHTVQAGDNLYRIALKYYGDASAVEKIKAANGLSSDSVPIGKTLVLP